MIVVTLHAECVEGKLISEITLFNILALARKVRICGPVFFLNNLIVFGCKTHH
jgi:hypothetical protein